MALRLLTELRLEFLSLKGGYTCSSEPTLVKMSHCWKSHVMAHISNNNSQFLRARGKRALADVYCCKMTSVIALDGVRSFFTLKRRYKYM